MVSDKFHRVNNKLVSQDLRAKQSPRVSATDQANNSRIAGSARKKPSAPLKIPEILKAASLEEFFSPVGKGHSASLGS